MKHFSLFLLLGFSLHLSAQNQKFRFGFSLNPAVSDNFLHNDGSVPEEVAGLFKSIENHSFGFYGYLFTQYALGPRSSLRLGLGYAQTGNRTAKKELRFEQPEPNFPRYTSFIYSFQDIMVPVLYRYKLGKRKNTFYVIGGPTGQVKLARTTILRKEYADGEVSKTKNEAAGDFKTLNVNGTVGIGYDLALSAQTRLFFQPTFDCNLLGVARSANLNRRIYTLGMNVGMTFY